MAKHLHVSLCCTHVVYMLHQENTVCGKNINLSFFKLYVFLFFETAKKKKETHRTLHTRRAVDGKNKQCMVIHQRGNAALQ